MEKQRSIQCHCKVYLWTQIIPFKITSSSVCGHISLHSTSFQGLSVDTHRFIHRHFKVCGHTSVHSTSLMPVLAALDLVGGGGFRKFN
jgi:hypothetical protein